MSIKFFYTPQSSADRVHGTLHALGVPYEEVRVNLRAGEQRTPEFLAINPNGKVPTLILDGTPMFESVAIQIALGERYGVEKGLWPALGSPEHLTALTWLAWGQVALGGAIGSAAIALLAPEIATSSLAEYPVTFALCGALVLYSWHRDRFTAPGVWFRLARTGLLFASALLAACHGKPAGPLHRERFTARVTHGQPAHRRAQGVRACPRLRAVEALLRRHGLHHGLRRGRRGVLPPRERGLPAAELPCQGSHRELHDAPARGRRGRMVATAGRSAPASNMPSHPIGRRDSNIDIRTSTRFLAV